MLAPVLKKVSGGGDADLAPDGPEDFSEFQKVVPAW